mmetsp:Transcript_73013/g.171173  ORF Transcript_73013/g.171173 Transcript_73013/m.171173 type:complete len:90 (+) Transcript_73013:54-323(+)
MATTSDPNLILWDRYPTLWGIAVLEALTLLQVTALVVVAFCLRTIKKSWRAEVMRGLRQFVHRLGFFFWSSHLVTSRCRLTSASSAAGF